MNDRKKILLVEDEEGLVLTLKDRLQEENYEVTHAGDGEEGLKYAQNGGFDLIILDLMLPKKGGLDICRDLRRQDVQTPIIMLTAKGQVVDKVLGLKLGANDYLAKPFEMMELMARIEVQLRSSSQRNTSSAGNGKEISFSDVKVNFETGEITKNDEKITLSAKEFHLLRFLINNEGLILTRDQLLNEVWGYDALPSTRTVDVHIAWLRQKLENDSRHPRHILTVHGMGYKFVWN